MADRKNNIVLEMARTMLSDSKLNNKFWWHSISTTIHIQNRGLHRLNTSKSPYELWIGRPTNVKYFRVFGSKCYIMRDDGKLEKNDCRLDEGIFHGYSCTRKSYNFYNLILNTIV